jgi:hypothetical protein
MVRTVSPARSSDLLRASADQVRRAVAILAQLEEDTAHLAADRLAVTELTAGDEAASAEIARQNTILQAQRSFAAALRLVQIGERESAR